MSISSTTTYNRMVSIARTSSNTFRRYFKHFLLLHSAVLAGTSPTVGTFPGPLIVGTKVGLFFFTAEP